MTENGLSFRILTAEIELCRQMLSSDILCEHCKAHVHERLASATAVRDRLMEKNAGVMV